MLKKKTVFLHQYIYETFGNFRSTVDIDIFEKYVTVKDNQRIICTYEIQLDSLITSLYRDSMGFLLLFDITNKS
ncbi:unnamed protein product [Rotaria sp. Silwood1]|nr:unnamed protein product [Rotaria sp. Silwood1]CAF4830968.1 unnamed protein product [Rotaria sp. Silwood1]